MPWYLYLAIKQLFPTGKKISFFAIMGTTGVMLGVMILIIVTSIFNGFGYQLQETFNQWGGDLLIQKNDGILDDIDPLLEKIEQNQYVIGASPFIEGIVMLQYRNKHVFPGVRGIDISQETKVVEIKNFITEGMLDDLDDESVIVSSGLRQSLGLKIGDKIEVYTPLMMQRLKEKEIILPREFKVIGQIHTKWNQIDANTLILTLRTMQDLYGLGNGVQGITVKIKPTMQIEKAAALLHQQLPENLKIIDLTKINESYFLILKMQKTMMFFIISFIVLVATFSIACSLMSTVVKKTKEIGLLCAMGAKLQSIAAVFCLQGFIIGIIGTILGIIGAFLAIHYRNPIVHFLMKILNRETLMVKFYYFSDLPAKYELIDLTLIIGFSILIATFAGLLPAIRAMHLKPSEALRSE